MDSSHARRVENNLVGRVGYRREISLQMAGFQELDVFYMISEKRAVYELGHDDVEGHTRFRAIKRVQSIHLCNIARRLCHKLQ